MDKQTEERNMTNINPNPDQNPYAPLPSDSDLKRRAGHVQDNMSLMQHYFDALFSKDLPPILDVLDENVEWLIVPTGDILKGKDEIGKLALNHWVATPDRIKKLVNLFASEDSACLEYITGGTLTKQADFPSIKIPPTGKKYEFMCCFVFHITNGKIDRVHEYFDMETVKRQLNVAGSADTSVRGAL